MSSTRLSLLGDRGDVCVSGCNCELEQLSGGMGNGGCETTCGDVKVSLITFEELQMIGFFLQMGFTLILATLDGLDVDLLGDVIGEDDCDEDE
ncbi:hypothetical protein Tco_1394903 [Tanacetum coccineum]